MWHLKPLKALKMTTFKGNKSTTKASISFVDNSGKKYEVVSVQAMRMYRGSRVIGPLFLNIGTTRA